MIRDDVVVRIPRIDFPRMPSWRKLFDFMVRPMSAVAASLAIAVFVLISLVLAPESPDQTNRFVLYRPDIAQVEITGSFTGWRRLPMDQIGQSGYWEIRLPVPRGEHRFSYILDGQYSVADPTILEKELDDFGSVNSLLRVGNEV